MIERVVIDNEKVDGDDAPPFRRLALHVSKSQQEPQFDRFYSALQSAIRNCDLEDGFGSAINAKIENILNEGVRKLASELHEELDVLNGAASHLKLLEHTWLFNPTARACLAELERTQQSALQFMQAFRFLENSAGTSSTYPIFSDTRASDTLSTPPLTQDLEIASGSSGEHTREHASATAESLENTSDHAPDAETALAYCRQAEIFRRQHEYVQAEANCNEAIRFDPNCRHAYSLRGLVYLQSGENDAAIDDFTIVLELKGPTAELHALRGDAYARSGQFDEAVLDYRQSLQLQPDLHKTRFNLGLALRRKGLSSDAEAEFTQVLKARRTMRPVTTIAV